MKYKYLSLMLSAIFSLLIMNSLSAEELNVSVQGIHETRSTDKAFNQLNVTLKATGTVIDDSARILPIKITNAYCDKDTLLQQLKGVTEENLFYSSGVNTDKSTHQTVLLTSPGRSNKKLFLEGELTAYIPNKSSMLTILDYQLRTKEWIADEVLERNGIGIIIFRKNEYDELLINAQKIKLESISNGLKYHDELLKLYDPALAEFIKNNNPYILDGFDIYFIVSGNWSNVVNIKVLGASGEEIQNDSRTLFRGRNKITLGLGFKDSLPLSGDIKIDVIQEGDTRSIPFLIETELP